MKLNYHDQRLAVSIFLCACLLVIGLVLTYKSIRTLQSSTNWVEHTLEVLIEAHQVVSDVKDIQINGQGYLLTGDEQYTKIIALKEISLHSGVSSLRTLTKDNAVQQLRVDSLELVIANWAAFTKSYSIAMNQMSFQPTGLVRVIQEGSKYEEKILSSMMLFERMEKELLLARREANNESILNVDRILIGLMAGLIILTIVIYSSVRSNKSLQKKILKHNIDLEATLKEVSDYKYALDESAIVAITDQKGIIKHVNNNFVKISKYSAEELLGQDHRIINSAYHPKELIRELWMTIANGKIWKGDLKNKAKDGTIYWVDTTIVPFLNDAGKPYQYVAIRSDITERKKAEEDLRKSLREISDYKYALDESSIVAITDQKGIIQFVNDKFCTISKYSRSELIGRDHRIVNSGYHPKEFIREIWVTIAHGKIWKGDLKNKAKDGTIYWVDTTIVPFLTESGKPYQYVAIRSDITQRKRSEDIQSQNEELREQVRSKTKELAGIFERITDGFIVLDKNFRYTYANKKIGEMTGKDYKTLLGKSVWEEFPDAVGSKTYQAFHKALQEQRYLAHIDYYQPLDLWQENHIYPTADGISVFIRDVTLQKRAEEKLIRSERIYKAVASNIPGSVICLLDLNYTYFLIEGDILEKLGYSKEMLLGRRPEDILPPERYDKLKGELERAFRGEVFSIETKRDVHTLLSRYVPLKDDEQRIYAVMIIVLDLTDLKKAEHHIAELNANLEKKIDERTHQLESANKEMEAFSYSVAHDLRTPLRAVAGYATMLVEDYMHVIDEEGMRLLKELQHNTEKMGNLIDDLLTFSRLGRKPITKSTVNMDLLIASALEEIGLHRAEIITGPLYPISADAALMKHVMVNLLSNAIKYSSKKENPRIEISSERTDHIVTYFVRDNGVGFDMKYAGKLFGVFQRLHPDEEFVGTGVGLAIVQRIVARHGGTVWAKAIVNEGATLYFTLPEGIPFDSHKI